jgi:hypothetical protein
VSRRAILHIGTDKTGTTALQVAFRRDAERLATSGVRYPDFRMPNHAALVFAAADELSHRRAKRLALAEAEIREVIALRPAIASYRYVLAELLHDLERTDAAREAIGTALVMEPDNDDFRRLAASLGNHGSDLCGAGEEINR